MFFFFFLLLFFYSAPVAYGSSWATGWSELQLPACVTAIATPYRSHIYDLYCSSQQWWILNPLSEARDRTCILMETMSGSQPAEPQQKFLKCVLSFPTLFFFWVLLPHFSTPHIPQLPWGLPFSFERIEHAFCLRHIWLFTNLSLYGWIVLRLFPFLDGFYKFEKLPLECVLIKIRGFNHRKQICRCKGYLRSSEHHS